METAVDADIIRRFLTEVGRRYKQPAQMLLLGGSALFLLGNTRPTLDIDYFGHDIDKDDLQNLEMVVDEALTHAGDYDLIPSTTLTHLAVVRNRFGGG